eukprot:TRINITY_DN12223_c0_g1_i1.p1 TRINITY_DN12223_c0_g1~~TRINITY_DN12223_c0_g1_i1.p1  ORF type:complete len:191 (-),score=37.21 TRINITY_DN12223_c0_g1_i1:237-809(-)
MSNLVVVLGDLHMPHRAVGLPQKFQALLQPNKIKQIICTGNLCGRETMDYFKSVCPDVVCTRGDFDDMPFQETETFTIGDIKFGLCHGHQIVPWGDQESLKILQRQLDCDVLITGHTHKFSAEVCDGKFFLNPGSATGAYNGLTSESVPTFLLMNIRGSQLQVWIYEYQGDDLPVKVEKITYTKGMESNA